MLIRVLPSRFFSLSTTILTALLTLGIILRWVGLDRTLGGFDENHYLMYFGFSSLKEIGSFYFSASNHIFHTLLMRLMMLGFGENNEIVVRSVSFISGGLCLILIYKLAFKIYGSIWIARVSLLITAICPVHILYSQTARGYGLMMFLSACTIYFVLKMLEDGNKKFLWAVGVALFGFLSVYTLPTNVYFILGLASWIFLTLCIPMWRVDFEAVKKSSRQYWLLFVSIFSFIAIMALLAYYPIRDQMMEVAHYDVNVAKEMYGLKDSLIQGVFFTMIPGTLALIFQSSLKWFLPFLAIGIIWSGSILKSYRWLPICIFLFPLVPTLITGVSGYPRNYLFNLPLLVIFLSGGIFKVGEWFESKKWLRNGSLFSLGLLMVYIFLAFKVLIMEHYPSLEIEDGQLYKQKLETNSNLTDLILISDPKYYLYARSTYKYNLKNIFLLNQIESVRVVVPKDYSLQSLSLLMDQGKYFIFKNYFNKHSPHFIEVGGGKKLYTVSEKKSVSVLAEDMEAFTKWKVIRGRGKLAVQDQVTAFGRQSLFLEAEMPSPLKIEGPILNQIKIEQPSLVILANVELSVNPERKTITVPRLSLKSKEHGLMNVTLLTGLVNAGLRVKVDAGSEYSKKNNWVENLSAGIILPGIYSISLQLSVEEGKSVLLDGFRLFFVELVKTH